ncbi:MAG TPA: MgtC/SapB family protein [Gammaproteobacteria bacterium]|nr:MgtC/SapB family protein [Gammaproteobacteria bacterium]
MTAIESFFGIDTALWHRLAIALGIGLIVGLERGWKTRDQHGGQRLAGLRTFAVTALCGGVLAAISLPDRFAVLAAGTLVVGALVVGGYLITVREQRDFGMTTELAMLTTFGLGAVAVLGAPFEATAAAIVMALLLGFKAEFHAAIEKLERQELLATLQLAAIAAVLLPLLPNRDLGPWGAVNPRVVGMLVLLIAGLSYVGYFAVRTLGARLGLTLTALFGGLSSSTAVTVAYARRARTETAHRVLLGAGILLAAATMVPRLVVELSAVNRSLLAALAPTFAALMLVPLVAVLYVVVSRRHGTASGGLELSNPLQLRAALGFGALLIVLFVATEGLRRWLGDTGTYAVAAIAAVLDVDAVTLAMAEDAARGTLDPLTAQRAIALAALVNTGAKGVLAAAFGGVPMLRSASAVLGAALLAGAVTAIVTLGA